MKLLIKNLCIQLEKDHNIKILFAIENGSRAWRMDSKDSDYDVRFVYARSAKDYLQINPPKDVIMASYDELGNPSSSKGAVIDFAGFDVFKFATLLSSSNPTTIEWLVSDIVYYGKQNSTFKNYATSKFNPLALFHHYKSSCKTNYLDYIKSRQLVTYKKYLYAYRGLVNAKYVFHKNKIPPIDFSKTLDELNNILPKSIISKLNNIIDLKRSSKEKDIIENIVEFDNYIESFLKDQSVPQINVNDKSLDILNKEIQKIILSK